MPVPLLLCYRKLLTKNFDFETAAYKTCNNCRAFRKLPGTDLEMRFLTETCGNYRCKPRCIAKATEDVEIASAYIDSQGDGAGQHWCKALELFHDPEFGQRCIGLLLAGVALS